MFIEPHFVGISPTQLSQRTGGPQQQGFINNYKVICFCVKFNWRVFSTNDYRSFATIIGVFNPHRKYGGFYFTIKELFDIFVKIKK